YFVPFPPHLIQMQTIPCILASGVLVAAFAFGPETRLRLRFEHPKLVTLGRLSYSFYLWHFPLIALVTRFLTPPRSRLENTIIAFLLSLGFAWISYRVIEMPFLRLKRRFES
ncbi:MAG: acyltransferase family protein, partial [Candidatus Xenobia bacterium]